ncbi:hypothetical protein BGY98DRAFT_233475 [Russula aff. rugulosa BPL654]|nr:hypothetical protein BGY98DRAFT_233475 [Russula aff. rugulosa BPL654]
MRALTIKFPPVRTRFCLARVSRCTLTRTLQPNTSQQAVVCFVSYRLLTLFSFIQVLFISVLANSLARPNRATTVSFKCRSRRSSRLTFIPG